MSADVIVQWLRTDLGGDSADLSVEQGAKATLERIAEAGPEQNGQHLKIRIEGWKIFAPEPWIGLGWVMRG